VAELVSEAEFYDLVAWLLNQRVAKAKE
jgi:hypothetical protein